MCKNNVPIKMVITDIDGKVLKEDNLFLEPKDILLVSIPSRLTTIDHITSVKDSLKEILEGNSSSLVITDDIQVKILKILSGGDENG